MNMVNIIKQLFFDIIITILFQINIKKKKNWMLD